MMKHCERCKALEAEIADLKYELLMVSKLSAKQPVLFGRMDGQMARRIRNRVLANNYRR